jgi:Uma2 family endonuclease
MALQSARPSAGGEPPPSLPRLTWEEYLVWAEDHPHSEWVDGEVIEFMATTGRHSLIVVFLFQLIGTYVRLQRLGLVFGDPYAIFTRDGRESRQPDVGVLLTANAHRFDPRREYLDGPADLVVEVVSKSSATRDREDKLDAYAAAGIPEYWIFEGRDDRQGVELYVRDAKATYDRVHPDADGRLHSTILPGFWLKPAWLAEDPLPDVDDLLEEIVPGIHEERAERARQRRAARRSG